MEAARHTPTLTARLLGDPAPDRFERARRLRDFHRVPDFDATQDRAARRARIVDLLKAGPLSIRAIADQLRIDSGHVRNDVERMMADGLTLRTGSGTGTHSNVLWHLARSYDDTAAALAAKPKRSKFRDLLDQVTAYMEPGVGYRPMDLYRALNVKSQSMHDTLQLGLAEGLLVKTGRGRGSTGTVQYSLARRQEGRAA